VVNLELVVDAGSVQRGGPWGEHAEVPAAEEFGGEHVPHPAARLDEVAPVRVRCPKGHSGTSHLLPSGTLMHPP
jgi:hypothetical protein